MDIQRRANKFLLPLILSSAVMLLQPDMSKGAEPPIGKLDNIIGEVAVIRAGKTLATKDVKKGMPVYATDRLITKGKATAKITFLEGTKESGSFIAFENSDFKIEEYKSQKEGDKVSLKSAFDIAKGKVRFFVKPEANKKIDAKYKTKNAVMGIRGTSGVIDATDPNKTQLVVMTGKVEVSNPLDPSKSVMVPANQMTSVDAGKPPAPPKPAGDLILKLNSETNAVDPGASSKETKSEPAPQKQEEKPAGDKKEAAKEEKVEKKTVFNPEGGASVAVTGNGTGPGMGLSAISMGQTNQKVNTTDVLKSVNNTTNQLNDRLNSLNDRNSQTAKTAAKGTTKKVKITVVLPK